MLILPKLEAPYPPLYTVNGEITLSEIAIYLHTLVDFFYNCNAPLADTVFGVGEGSAEYNQSSFTYGTTGYTAAVTGTAHYVQVGKLMTVNFGGQVTGTSNATTFTITGIPAALDPLVNGTCIPIATFDNGVAVTGMMQIFVGGVWSVFSNYGGGGWTAAGLKGIQTPVVTYMCP